MNNFEILKDYSKGDLRRLAKGKISEIVGLDADKILRDLSKVLGNYESVKRNTEFRTPPTDTILEVLLEAPEHRIRVDDLRPLVKERIQNYIDASKSIDFRDGKKNYRLYAKMLAAAWEFDDDLIESEANLLRVLRTELGITRKEHQLVTAHCEVARLKFVAAEYEASLAFLTGEGLVLVCCASDNASFVLSDETADSLLQLWGFEMQRAQYERLLDRLSNPLVAKVLKAAGLRTSGSRQELVNRIIENEIPPSRLLKDLGTDDLVALLAKLGLPKSGTREERILRVGDHFRSDADIVLVAVEEPAQEVVPEPESLSDEARIDLLDHLGIGQLADALASLGLQKSGSKGAKIDRLLKSPFSSESVLRTLRLDDVRELAIRLGLRKAGNKPELIESIVTHFAEDALECSSLTSKDLLDFYDELSSQDKRAYPAGAGCEKVSATRMGLDFERATRYVFKNLLRLDTKVQTSGQEEPDGILTDDDGSFYCYECKTVLAPPYSLPIQHRLQIRNYIKAVAKSRRADQFSGYLIIAHSFVDGIERRLLEIDSPIDVPIAAIEARDLLAFGRKWQEGHPMDTYPIGRVLKAGRITARDLQRAARI